jgi:hypothetical protein
LIIVSLILFRVRRREREVLSMLNRCSFKSSCVFLIKIPLGKNECELVSSFVNFVNLSTFCPVLSHFVNLSTFCPVVSTSQHFVQFCHTLLTSQHFVQFCHTFLTSQHFAQLCQLSHYGKILLVQYNHLWGSIVHSVLFLI